MSDHQSPHPRGYRFCRNEAGSIVAVRIDTDRYRNIVHFLRSSTSSEETSQVLRILPFSGMKPDIRDRAPAWQIRLRSHLPKEQLGTVKVLRGTISQFARHAGPLVSFLRTTFLAARIRRWRWKSPSPPAVQPPERSGSAQGEGIFHHARNKCRALTRRERSLVCPANCGSCIFTDST